MPIAYRPVGRRDEMIMRTIVAVFLLCLSACLPAIADQGVAEMPQLQQLNRASQQQLRDIQGNAGVPEKAWPPNPQAPSESLNRRQLTEQQRLQETQRRTLMMEKQRARTAPAGRSERLNAIDRQSRFRLQQQNQLNRFRVEQGAARNR